MLAALLLIVLFVPVERYRPSCREHWNQINLEGPMREEYIGMLTQDMDREGFSHIRIGNEIFVRVLYPVHLFNHAPNWTSLGEFLDNTESKIAAGIAGGYRPDGTRSDPPPALAAMHAKAKALLEEERLRRNEKAGWHPFFSLRLRLRTVPRRHHPHRRHAAR
ncbi:MAG TPA: hypothetical protein VD978_02370 [Azospirillum sp.]|nr:hypothetical protein [Azospirillum sp.]